MKSFKQLAQITLLLTIISISIYGQSMLPELVSGKIHRIENFESVYIASRNIDIWLPDEYADSINYSVLYMHDGQMLFDPKKTWNKQAWNIDAIASELQKTGQVIPFIVVGIWNNDTNRHADYFPKKPFENLSQEEKDTVNAQLQRVGRTNKEFIPESDLYLKFIVEELKPYVDKNYSIYRDKSNTCIAGSSMGGLISIYALSEYPEIFGCAACLSTHWPGSFTMENNPIPNAFFKYLKNYLPEPGNHRIYFDCGDQTLDAFYPPLQNQVDKLMIEKNYEESNWKTMYFPGKDHSENAWSERLHIPLMFLFGRD
jgi:predicted alpha/beta superfamily hydrolase